MQNDITTLITLAIVNLINLLLLSYNTHKTVRIRDEQKQVADALRDLNGKKVVSASERDPTDEM